MRRFWHNCKGAVTVFISLLMIPAVLISGTAVDMARIYSMRSIVKDANQLAANSALAYYDALLKDMYGLFAIAQNDENFANILTEYVKATVFEEGYGEGNFTFFRGKTDFTTTIQEVPGANLANYNVLHQQIDEYMKFRAPVIIVQEIMGKIDSFVKLANDAAAIKKKLEVDEEVEEVMALYGEFYEHARYNDYYLRGDASDKRGLEIAVYDGINLALEVIYNSLRDIATARDAYWTAEDEKKAAEDELKELQDSSPPPSEEDSDEEEQENSDDARSKELEETIKDCEKRQEEASNSLAAAKETIYAAISTIEVTRSLGISATHESNYYEFFENPCCFASYKENIVAMGEIADAIVKKVGELQGKIEGLKNDLNRCSKELAGDEATPGLREELSNYDDLFKDYQELPGLVSRLKSSNDAYIDALGDHLLNDIGYGDVGADNKVYPFGYTLETLKNMVSNTTIQENYPEATTSDFQALLDVSNYSYNYFYRYSYGNEFLLFSGLNQIAGELYLQMSLIFLGQNDEDSESNKSVVETMLNNMGDQMGEILSGLSFEVEGVRDISAIYEKLPSNGFSETTDLDTGALAEDENMGKMGDNNKAAQNGLGSAVDLFSAIGSLADSASRKVLLLTYDSEMFSDFTTKHLEDPEDKKSIAGIPYGPSVNYLMDWELEYLFLGGKTAVECLGSVAGLLLLTRFVFNYIASFRVKSVNDILAAVRNILALALPTPVVVVIKELLRVGLAFGESALDVACLRGGGKVPLMKNDTTWQLANPKALLDEFAGALIEASYQTAFDTMKQAILQKLSDVQVTIDNTLQKAGDTLNRAQEIDNAVRSVLGENQSYNGDLIGELSNQATQSMDELKKIVNETKAPPLFSGEDTLDSSVDNVSQLDTTTPDLDQGFLMSYTDYLRLYLLLFVPDEALLARTSDLIAMNVTNKQNGGSVTDTNLYKMNEAYTFVGVTTYIHMDLLFLSMPFANVNGTAAPNSFPIYETEYRGY